MILKMNTIINKHVFSLLLLSGWFGVSSLAARDYFYVDMAKTWLEAQSYCREKHTDLATVENMGEMQTVINKVDLFYLGDVWIGLRKGAGTSWGWSIGNNTQRYNMLQTTNSSNSLFNNGSCGAISPDGYWYSINCYSQHDFICYDEYSKTIYSPIYIFTWRDAQAYCRSRYTDLVSIYSAAQQQKVLSLTSLEYTWIGLFGDAWKWSDESNSFFRYWGTGKPFSLFNISNCVVMQMKNLGMWDNSLCDRQLPFICYKEIIPMKRQIVRIKVRSQGITDLNDPHMKANILKMIEEMLTSRRMINYTLSWRDGGIVFYPESDNI